MAAQNFCEDFAPRNEAARLCWERGANRAAEMSAAGRDSGRPVGVAHGDISVCRRDSANRSRRWHAPARNFCEDFAPRNEAARLCGGRGANRAAEKVAGGRWRRGISVKILLPGTKPQGFAGGGEQIAPLKKPPEADGGAELL